MLDWLSLIWVVVVLSLIRTFEYLVGDVLGGVAVRVVMCIFKGIMDVEAGVWTM